MAASGLISAREGGPLLPRAECGGCPFRAARQRPQRRPPLPQIASVVLPNATHGGGIFHAPPRPLAAWVSIQSIHCDLSATTWKHGRRSFRGIATGSSEGTQPPRPGYDAVIAVLPPHSASGNAAVNPRLPAHIGPYTCGPGRPLLVIAGPCVMESERLCLGIADTLARIAAGLPIQLVFKASFDKANRTSAGAYRGLGIDEGLSLLDKVRAVTGLPVTTDMHLPEQAPAIGEVCDLIQIPAFLCRQTDLLLAAAATGRAVNVKKGQFLAPADMRHAVAKLLAGGCQDICLCERGTFFGYGRLVNDFTGLPVMRGMGVPVIFDATHSVQQPASLGDATGGDRTLVEPLARAAAAVGIDGLFLETHPDPDRSPSDGANMVPLDKLQGVLERVLRIHDARLAGAGEVGA